MVAFLNRWFYGKIQIEDACRLVLHVKDDPNRYMQTGFNFGFSSRLDRLRQVVIVLHPEGPRISTPGGDRYLIPLLGDWLAMFRSRSSQCKFTFVGLEQRGQQVDMVERELHAMCAKGQPSDYKLPSLSKFRERVTFTTLQDWRAELRREGKVIEGVWAEPR
ncbi:hypothetical protein Q8F55_000050 [Vanrija albida]|uniref:FACT complex subunit n=1 Tax=Vanrija albida TaxID=181172 RepID=A0ABR3QD62_9TREE